MGALRGSHWASSDGEPTGTSGKETSSDSKSSALAQRVVLGVVRRVPIAFAAMNQVGIVFRQGGEGRARRSGGVPAW